MADADAQADFRNALVKREAPRALVWTGGVIAALSAVTAFTSVSGVAFANVMHAGVVLAFMGGAWLSARRGTPASVVSWIVAGCSTVFVGSVQIEVVIDPSALGMAYVLMGMLAFGPFTLSFRAMLVAAILMSAGFVPAAWAVYPDQVFAWCLAAVAALAIGGVLLRVRVTSIDALGDLTNRNRELATRDALTGVLNRRGIEERVPDLVAVADRHDDVVFAKFVDIDGLKAANDRYGHDFGDEVIRATAAALRWTVRAGDLVGRWGGDEFIVVGMGHPVPPEVLAERLRVHLHESGIDLAKWPAALSVGTATAPAGDFDFVGLIAAADADMYEGRRTRRQA